MGARLSLKDRRQYVEGMDDAAKATGKVGDAARRAGREAGSAEGGFRRFEGAAARAGEKVGRTFGRGVGLGITAIRNLVRVTAIGGAALVAGGVIIGGHLVKLAGQIEASGAKAKVVFGTALPQVSKWAADAAAKMGLTRSEAIGLAAGFADLLIPMGFTREQAAKMSGDTIGLAGALSQWSGGARSAAEVSEILAAAMLGETDSLKGLGIAIGAADIDAKIAERGQKKLTGAAMEQARALAIQTLIMEKSTDAQAAYAKGGLKVQGAQAKLKAGFKELREQAAVRAEPYIITALTWLQKRLPGFEKNVRSVGSALTLAFRMGGTRGVVQMIDHLTGSGGKLTKAFDKVKSAGQDAFKVLAEVILPKVRRTIELVGKALDFVADHTTAAYVLLSVYGGIRIVMLGVRAATATAAAAQRVYTIAQRAGTLATRAGSAAMTAYRAAIRGAAAVARGARVGFALMWAAATGPVGLVVLALVGVGVALVVLWKKCETFRTVVKTVFREVGKAVLGVVDTWLGTFQTLMAGLGKLPGKLGAPFRTAAGKIGEVREKLKGVSRDLDDLGRKKPVLVPVTAVFSVQGTGAQAKAARAAVGAKLDGMRANGGPVLRSRAYLIGERGPEFFVPSLSGEVVNQQQAAAAVARLSAPSYATAGSPVRGGDGGGSLVARSITVGDVHVYLPEGADVSTPEAYGRETLRAVGQALEDQLARR